MFNQPPPDSSTEAHPSYVGRSEPSGNAWRAILIREPDLAWFLIADGLDEKDADRYATAAALSSDPPLEAALLRARHLGAQMVRELRELDAAGRPYFGVTEIKADFSGYRSVLVRRRDGHRFAIGEFLVEQEAYFIASHCARAPDPPAAAANAVRKCAAALERRARERRPYRPPETFPRLTDFFIGGRQWAGMDAVGP